MLPTILSSIADVAVALAAITTCFSVGFGYRFWKKQQRAKIEHDLAFRVLSLVYKCEVAIEACRNPMVNFQLAENGEATTQNQREFQGYANEYNRRYEEIRSVLNEIHPETLHIKILWSDQLDAAFKGIDKCCFKLFLNIRRHLKNRNPLALDDDLPVDENILYSLGNNEQDNKSDSETDKFKTDLDGHIETIRAFLSPKLLK